MKLINMKKFYPTSSLVVVSMVWLMLQGGHVEAAPRLVTREPESFRQVSQVAQTDPELNSLDNLKLQQQQQQANSQQANFGMTKQQFNNGPDVAPFSHYQPMRHQSQKSAFAINNNQASQFPLQQLQFEDEHAMRRQLPDLIAQAHTDKNMERALLKMLINASLRSALTNAAASSSAYAWRQDGAGEPVSGLDGGSAAPRALSARLEQVIDDFTGVDPIVGNDLSQPSSSSYPQEQQYPSVIGKREYLKPCFFNAVACAKNPFRDSS